ncbi:tetratricopeptide repeat protein [Amycolatopsis sp. cg5]|uniref:ATP-binding protein n=1 Tax=Amycolatopsis sp. cg5 TaxID=3238802 RepID=UPI003523B4E2
MYTTDERDPHAVGISLIVGTAGVGKTSLAVHWAHRMRDSFPDGQLYVNLRGYDPGEPMTSDYALDQFLRALNVRPDAIPADPAARAALYRSLVSDRRILIVLDNAASVGQVRPLLPGTSSCLVIVTSRSQLPGLAVRDGARQVPLPTLSEHESLTLLRAVTSDYRAGDDDRDLAELARLCARLPLALRIAAVRAVARPRMHLSELIQDLRGESSLWDALSTDDEEEAGAIRTVFAWSYRALSAEAARLFKLLGLHPRPEFGTGVAAALAGVAPSLASRHLDALVGAHLLESTGRDRYQFHDLLRAFAVDQIQQEKFAELRKSALHRMLSWYLHTARAAGAAAARGYAMPIDLPKPAVGVNPLTFTDADEAVRWYEIERANLVTVTETAAEAGLHDLAWRLPPLLTEIYMSHDPVYTWLRSEETALESAKRAEDSYGEAVLLDSLAVRLRLDRKFSEATAQYRRAADLFRQLGDRFGEARSMNGLGLTYLTHGKFDEARREFERTLPIAQALGKPDLTAVLLRNLGCTYADSGQLSEAERFLRQALVIFRETASDREQASTLRYLSEVQRDQQLPEAARSSLEQALEIGRRLADTLTEGLILLELSKVEIVTGDLANALESSQRAATILRRFSHRSREAQALDTTGEAYQRLGRAEDATAFHRQAASTHRELGDDWQLAVSLHHLAAALKEIGKTEEARLTWEEVATLLEAATGNRAGELRELVSGELNTR